MGTVYGTEDPITKIDNSASGLVTNEWFSGLKEVSFDVHRGEVIGIIGRNGVGKSKLIRILSRVAIPTTRNVKVKRRIASLLKVGGKAHGIVYLFI